MKVFCVSCIFIAVCLFGTALAVTGRTGEPNFSCSPGERFQEDCNNCICNGDGTNAACTLKACPKTKRQAAPAPQPQPGEEGYCTPDAHFKQDCNWCTCTPDGRYAACTEMACVHSHSQQKRQAHGNPGKQPGEIGYCTPGHSFRLECNTCSCSSNGRNYECTLMACKGYERHINKRNAPNTPGFTCTPNQQFQYECNTCNCGPDGRTAACTFKLCGRKRRQAVQAGQPGYCTPGQQFKQDCNTCTCTPDGRNAFCTLIGCNVAPPPRQQKREALPLPLLRNVRQTDSCQDGETKTIDCNNCRCNQNQWACTRKTCPRDKRQAQCQPGERTTQDCNTCNCVDGHWRCTKRACVSKREVPADDFKGTPCVQNDKFNIDCNTCYCKSDGSGYSCTEKVCGETTQR